MYHATPSMGRWLRSVVQGHFQYYVCPATNGNSTLSDIRCDVSGSGRYGDGANVTELLESVWTDWLRNGSHL